MSLKQKERIDLIILFLVMSTIIISVAEFLYNDCFSLDNTIAPSLYGCIFTIAALSGTVLSILVSALDKKTYVQYIDLGYNDINTFKDESLRVSAFSCCHYFLETLIKREFKSVELSFDIAGVNTLLDLINTQKIIYGNYIFTNDLIFSKEVRESKEFKLLEQKLGGLSGCNDENIYDHIYFGENIPQYNIKVYKPDRKSLTKEEIEEVCSQNKLAEDRYKVQSDCFCNKQQATEYVERFYRKDMIKIEVKHNFKDVNAYYVKIKRNRIKPN